MARRTKMGLKCGCRCGGCVPCAACAPLDSCAATISVAWTNFSTGSGTAFLPPVGGCVFEGCAAFAPGSIWFHLDLSGAVPLFVVRLYSAAGCTGTFSECRSDLTGSPNGLFLVSNDCPIFQITYNTRKTTSPTATWCNALFSAGFASFVLSQ